MRSLPLCLSALSVLLTGCTLANTAAPNPLTGAAIGGKVYGGQQPVASAKVYLLAVNPAAYGSGSLSLLTSAGTGNSVDTIGAYTTSDPLGNFTLSGDYSCTKGYALGATTSSGGTTLPGNEQIYLYALGGDSGSGTNSSIGLLAALGPCNAQYSSTLQVNEVTTVAAAYAFSGFATDATHISSSGTTLALTGLTNAGLNSANLVSVNTGQPVANSTGITRPVSTLYTIADILAACVNSSGATSSCSTLFQYTESSGATGTAPTDTATAAINLAHYPYPTSTGVTALYNLAGINPPFVGGLSSQPNDFSLSLKYTGGGVTAPEAIAIDASGNAWTTNNTAASISEFSSTGTPISTSAGFTGGGLASPFTLAIDASGNVWVANNTGGTISKFNSSGGAVSTSSGYTGGGLSASKGIAVDASGNVWVASSTNNALAKFNSSGTALSTSSGYTGGGLSTPFNIAIDASGNVWAANYSSASSISKFNSSGTAVSSSGGYTGGGLYYPNGMAIDPSGNAWTNNESQPPPTGSSPNSISKFSSTGSAVSGSNGYTGGGVSSPVGLAVDGSGRTWVLNGNFGNLSVFTNSGTAVATAAYGPTAFNFSLGLAVDGSGDVWEGNYSSNAVTEFIGIATPVVTPIVANLISPYTTPASKP
jgi:sugar lactone lactonase YvrE